MLNEQPKNEPEPYSSKSDASDELSSESTSPSSNEPGAPAPVKEEAARSISHDSDTSLNGPRPEAVSPAAPSTPSWSTAAQRPSYSPQTEPPTEQPLPSVSSTPAPSSTGPAAPMSAGTYSYNGSSTPVETVPEAVAPTGLLDMVEGETIVQEVDSGDEGRFILTSRRLIYHGKSFDNSLFSSAWIEDITSVELSRKRRDSRSAWWGLAGAIASVAVWQVTTNETVGAVAGAVVGAISALLLADYWFRPPGLVLHFSAAGGGVSGPVSGKRAHDAEKLAASLQRLRHNPDGLKPVRRDGPMGPPGGSPGLF